MWYNMQMYGSNATKWYRTNRSRIEKINYTKLTKRNLEITSFEAFSVSVSVSVSVLV